MTDDREAYGRLVNDTRRAYDAEQAAAEGRRGFCIPGWDDRPEFQRELDRRIGEAVAAAERERVRFALLGCVRCRTVHDRRLNYDHPWQPRYLSPGYGDTNNYVGRVIDGAGYE